MAMMGQISTDWRSWPPAAKQRLLQRLQAKSKAKAPDEIPGLLEWTQLHRSTLKPGVRFDLAHHRYLREIYEQTARDMVISKAAQMGASEYCISYALHASDKRNATVLYLFPTDGHVSDFSAARIGPAIEASEYLDSIIVEGNGAGGKRGADRVTLKRVRDRFLYLRGAQVKVDGNAPQLKSIDADVVIYDEVDEMDARAPLIGEKRLGHSAIAEQRWISTPTYAGRGIHQKWMASDQREWNVRCGVCNEWQPMTIDQVVQELDQVGRPVAWHGMKEARAFVACRKCGAELDRTGPGCWVPQSSSDVAGYHITKLFSAQRELLDVVLALQTVDETKRKEAYNQDLGLPYAPQGGQLTDVELDACRREYLHGVVPGERTVAGVDVGKVLHAVIRGGRDPETGERPQRWAGEVLSFEDLAQLLKRYDVQTTVVDALPETTKARELQTAMGRGHVWIAYYVTQKVGSKKEDPVQRNDEEGTVNLDRTRTLDATFARFMTGESTLPANARDITNYYDHLKASVRRIEETGSGLQVATYIETGSDHLAHAENYCMVASEVQGGPPAGFVVDVDTAIYRSSRRSIWNR